MRPGALLRGLVCGPMTIAGGIGHTLPYLIPSFWTTTLLARAVVVVELASVAYIQYRYGDFDRQCVRGARRS